MPMPKRKPNLGSQLKTSFNMSIPRAGAQRPGRVGQIATNVGQWKNPGGGNSGGSAPKRGKGRRMY